ncbi:MAG: DUF3783 domain-containing protein [Candidatus Poribacteria bacterium]|nr:DUF3783 domain-containing protein [Candidatus Poribacteria bacterium]
MAKEGYQQLNEQDTSGEQDGKVIILHGFSPAQLHAVVKAYREATELPQDVAFATVTEQSARKRLGSVVKELRDDAREAKKRRDAKARSGA